MSYIVTVRLESYANTPAEAVTEMFKWLRHTINQDGRLEATVAETRTHLEKEDNS